MTKNESSTTKTAEDFEKWSKLSQQGEYEFHLNNKWRQTDDFMRQTTLIFEHFGFTKDQFAGKTIIDLGAGSKLRTRYFEGAKIVAIEPLAARFQKDIQWSDLSLAEQVYSTPAEQLIPDCQDIADLVISINVLDHCFGFEQIVSNVFRYVKKGGTVFFSFDKHVEADDMHPLSLDEDICQKIFTNIGFQIVKQTRGFGGVIPGETYGHGPYCLNYWLTK